ncbi:Rod shape-determining protein MreC [Pediococcus damnosus]|uniref:Cell shape-determining protein MreC n=1 Tax=Pediococcus damnosus TaxID=51663 RepID=A0A0R2HKG1_9LACO|nr:rod shape-determining protein MreC [Pediococcus damnosus]AMV61251.1 Rod shape-determining protein MreC [Pediococcus damnosus]AMV62432.1 Rod shape-determining protein MreC [Pediococcus damnosus]AMV65611.1 Rod shape-determining protein MreC [Pediococcus damnosus]AMV67703.1 Rod shape-determining protein MreC [Pediococcus damnosus]AMV68970.1 Rod shape-determining protein MreC [Pediococcus damnosus]
MQKFFSNRKLVIAVICVIIAVGLVTLSVTTRKKSTTPIVQKVGNDAVALVDRVVAYPMNAISNTSRSLNSIINTYQENERLKGKVDQLEAVRSRDQALEQENKQLKQQVSLKKTMTDYKLVTATVISRAPSSWQNIVVINKGTLSGIKKNQSVIAGEGLIGRVIEASYSTSKVELISDSSDSANRFAIQVQDETGSSVNGIVTSFDRGTNEIVMGQVTSKAKIKRGSLVTTSGLGGVTPKGLYVGKVVDTKKNSSGLATEVYIKPAADMSSINVVSVAELN